MLKSSRITFVFATLIILVFSGCATGPRIHSLHDPAANFSQFTTYNFAPEAETGGEKYSSFLTQYLKQAISREMEARGYQKSDNPDLLVNFNVKTKEKIHTVETPAFRRLPYYHPYYYYRYGFYHYHPWPYYEYETRVTQYTEGTLNIDLINADEKQLVWEGVAIGRVGTVRENLRENVFEVVDSVFEKYPFVAGKAEPVLAEDE